MKKKISFIRLTLLRVFVNKTTIKIPIFIEAVFTSPRGEIIENYRQNYGVFIFAKAFIGSKK